MTAEGNVTGKTDATGAVTYQAAYEAFGEHPTESGSTADRQKANTKEEDPTGLLNEGFRYRDLETGMFITRDPIGVILMQPKDKWFLDGREVSLQEYHHALDPLLFVDASPDKTAKSTGQEDHSVTNVKSHWHVAMPGETNIYIYIKANPWTHFDPEGLDVFFFDMISFPPHAYVQVGGDKPVATNTPNAKTYGFGPNSSGKMWGGGPDNVSSPDIWGHGIDVKYIQYKTTPAEEAKLKEYIENKYDVNKETSPKNPNYNADWYDCRDFKKDIEHQLKHILEQEGKKPETKDGPPGSAKPKPAPTPKQQQ